MILEINKKIKYIFWFLILFNFSVQENANIENEENYYFTIYPAQDNQSQTILYGNNPFSEILSINRKEGNQVEIQKEMTNDYIYKNISSVLLYNNQYLIKTCYGPNKIMEILSQDDMGKKETQKLKYTFTSENNFNVTNSIIFCYSSIIKNPDNNFPDKKAIMTFWSEKNNIDDNSQNLYSHKYVLFYPDSQRFSNSFSFHSDLPSYFSKVFPQYCTTFRETDIFCTINNEDNQLIIETDKILVDTDNIPSLYVIKSILAREQKNMRPISLNEEVKSIEGGLLDTFLLESHDKEKNETTIYYSFYRKSSRFSLTSISENNVNLFYGISLKDFYVGYNYLDYLVPNPNEVVFVYIYDNMIQATRVYYSLNKFEFRSLNRNNLGYYYNKLDENCKIPKFLKSTYINNYIEYNSTEQSIVNNNKLVHYIYKKDISLLISCSNSPEEDNSEIYYISKIIDVPQCLCDLDSLHGFEYHKINFFLSIDNIIYDIYADPRLASFRNTGIVFYPIEKYYNGIIKIYIKTNELDYFTPKDETLYLNITHIKFTRIKSRYIPYFRRPFYLKYRLYKYIYNDNYLNSVNRITSNLCYFQIRFFPFDQKDKNETLPNIIDNIIQGFNFTIPENCTDEFCALCNESKDICKACDTNEIKILIPDVDPQSKTYGKCICDTSLGFLKEPNSEFKMCMCQEDYSYYQSTDLCWKNKKLENGPYYIKTIDDYTHTPIYDNCFYTCKKCSNRYEDGNQNCLQCRDGYAYIDDDISNCYDIKDLGEGYHQVDKDHFIKCHDNCISCSKKYEYNKISNETNEFCTECKINVPFMLKNSFMDESFNCLEKKCKLNEPSFIQAYNDNSYECLKDCEKGVTPFNSSEICWQSCNNDYPFLDTFSKKCYSTCNKNDNISNIYSNYALGICTDKCYDNINPTIDNICLDCDGNIKKYRNKKGDCIDIPKQCLTVDINTGLCKKCNEGYYPLKEYIYEQSFNCYENIADIFDEKNKSNYYFNQTGQYWDECYEACESCNSYGSENRQRCNACKNGYHYVYYFENNYNNCKLNLSSYDNCSSTQEDIYKYKDYCHFCKEGYAFVYNTDKCRSEEELKNGSFYEDKIIIKKDYNTNQTMEVKIYYPCHKNCKSCNGKGDFYDNNCIECKKGYIFDKDNYSKTCIKNENDNIIEEKEEEEDKDIESNEDIWFKLGDEIFPIYQQDNCFIVFYEQKIFLISNKNNCHSICPSWTNNIDKSTCKLKQYSAFKNMTREFYNNLLKEAYIYDDIKDDVNIIFNKEDKNLTFHLTNFASQVPNNLSFIHIDEYENKIKELYNISSKDKLLSMKVDIKRKDTKSTQVEYQFYHPQILIKKLDLKLLNKRRRLDGETENSNTILKIDLPVNWTEQQIQNFDELNASDIDAFDSSSEFYTDNCNQFTTSNGNDIFLDDRKIEYYPDETLCEDGCNFLQYNYDTKKITCQCDYKSNADNYENVVFKKNPVDEKFKKKHIFENLLSMKCISKIFKPENLNKNPGFIIMILFMFIFVVSAVVYFLLKGYLSVNKQINEEFKIEKLKELFNDKKDDNHEEQNLKNNPSDDNIKDNENHIDFQNNKNDNNNHLSIEENNKKTEEEVLTIKDKKSNNNTNIPKNDLNGNTQDNNNLIDNVSYKNIKKNKSSDIFSSELDISKDKEYELGNDNDNNNVNNDNNDNNNNNVNNANNNDNNNVNNNNNDNNNVNNNNNDNNNVNNINVNNDNNDDDNVQVIKRTKNKDKQNDQKSSQSLKSKKKDSSDLISNTESKKNGRNSPKDELISNNNSKEKSSEDALNNGENQQKEDNKKDKDDDQEIEFGEENLGVFASNAILNNTQNEENNNNNNNVGDNNNKININSLEENKNENNDSNNKQNENNENNGNLIDSTINNDNINNNLKIEDVEQNEMQTKQNDKKEKPEKKSEKEPTKSENDNIPENKYKVFDAYSLDSGDKDYNVDDLVSNFDMQSNNANPPKRNNSLNEPDKDSKNNELFEHKILRDNQLSSERIFIKRENNDSKTNVKKKCSCLSSCYKLFFTCKSDDEKSFKKIYIDDLKKHHIILYTFANCCNRDNLFLKLSFFAFSVHLYFGLNTILTFNLSMAESYFNKKKSKIGFIIMNLLLPFVICGLISFIIKIFIMPQYFMERVQKKIKNNEKIKEYIQSLLTEKKEEKEEIKKEEIKIEPSIEKKKYRRDIKNKKPQKDEKKEEKIDINKIQNNLKQSMEFLNEHKDLKEEAISAFKEYLKTVIIYFIVGFIIIFFNWYMMTSFCSIYRNTGIKLIVNSFISLFASFIIPFILGLIPSLFGFLASKTGNKIFRKIYEIINFII